MTSIERQQDSIAALTTAINLAIAKINAGNNDAAINADSDLIDAQTAALNAVNQ